MLDPAGNYFVLTEREAKRFFFENKAPKNFCIAGSQPCLQKSKSSVLRFDEFPAGDRRGHAGGGGE
jgi:hypothetical protein